MKWETIKKRVASNLYTQIIEGRSWEAMSDILLDIAFSNTPRHYSHYHFKEYADKAYEIVMNWDIRSVGRLRNLFPQYFPKSLREGNLIAFYDEKDCWQVEKK